MCSKKSRWLKKYTNLKHLEYILKEKKLYLGAPHEWDDQNDGVCIQLFTELRDIKYRIRATCLTSSPDRFHFWDIYGGRKNGVCLWFDRDKLVGDINNDSTLISNFVEYRSSSDLNNILPEQLPFLKREQYRDECEFRVMRTKELQGNDDSKFAFSSFSLKKIYLNPWLNASTNAAKKMEIGGWLKEVGLDDVEVKQNRSLLYEKWLNKVKAGVVDE